MGVLSTFPCSDRIENDASFCKKIQVGNRYFHGNDQCKKGEIGKA